MIWGYGYDKESRTVDMHIKTLRKKLGHKADIIKTIHGVGYKLIKDWYEKKSILFYYFFYVRIGAICKFIFDIFDRICA